MKCKKSAFARSLAAPVLAACGALAVPTVIACGDKLVGLGGGVPFARVHAQAKQPGFVVLLAPPDSALHSYNEASRLGQALQRAGHRVQLVESGQALAGLLANADVVLTDAPAANGLRGQMPKGHATPLILGLESLPAGTAVGEPALANCQIRASAKQGSRVARVVEQIITRRQSGATIDCASGGNRT